MKITLENTNAILVSINALALILKCANDVMEILKNEIMMAIRRCVNCGTPLPDNETYCTRCGFENGK